MDRAGQARNARLILQPPPAPAGVLVGYSGGLDSGVLLHLLAHDAGIRRTGLRAIHVHHGLHADADAWAMHCVRECEALEIPLRVVHVEVDREAGLGIEGAARAARHRAFAEAIRGGEILALAHHRDDQAETFLLRALRGSGVDGLAAMRPWREYGTHGWLWRPLLATARDVLHAYARGHGLRWVDDPGNADARFDRNFLRSAVIPLLRERWPHAVDSLARSAELAAQAASLLDAEDAAALDAIRDGDALDVAALRTLSGERRARVLRRWIDARGLPPLPGNGIERIETGLLAAREDAEARFDWAGARVRRWRDRLHADRIREPLPREWSRDWDGAEPLDLPTGDGLELVGARRFDAPLRAHARLGGERIVLPGRRHSHALKHVLQDMDVPTWQRERLPLLSDADGELLAAGDAILSARMAAWLQAHGARLRWTRVA